ncbi:NB-ARC domain, LRR domain containing protein [Parasponia andersonii]|uniref:NB-ARC domain, LRR domain containing protein n=1 Tax=Parasponia andersonii TaxID=3476 RepID=A0A2P5CQM3_PARAD|nr:NB-ARC domain, LRR domain containing protein [Parasponia andersonii]
MAESVVTFLLDNLSVQLQDEFRLLRSVRDEVQYIVDELERIKSFLRVADAMEENDANLKVWVKQVRDVAYDIEDSLDEFNLRFAPTCGGRAFHARLRNLLRFVKNLRARHRIASEIQGIKSRVGSISEGRRRYAVGGIGSSSGGGLVRRRLGRQGDALLLEEADLVGIGEPKRRMIEWLMGNDSGRQVVSVVGMGGLGKTTLVKQVYEDPRVKKRFKVHAWVTVSRSFKTKDLLKDVVQQIFRVIRKPVPPEVSSMNNDNLKESIKDLLKQSRYLIVLDDVWHVRAWESIKLALPRNDKYGSRVLITTRNAEIASSSCVETNDWVFSLAPLAEEESWDLFCKKAFQGNSCPPHLEETCRLILKRCGGLPLAIVAIGAVLGAKDKASKDEWSILRDSIGPEIEGNYNLDSMKRVLSLSYSDLPYYLKSCFLYLSMFPALQNIENMRLVRLWIAEGFVVEKEGKTLEEVAEGYFKELLDRGLIQAAGTTNDGRIKSCRIHDLLREIAILKSKEQDFAEITKEQGSVWSDKARRLSVLNTPQNVEHKNVSKLRSLLVFVEEDSVAEFSLSALFPRGFRLLKVLDLRGVSLEIFPKVVVKLFHLRYLSLRDTKVKHIPGSIKKLQNLETLDLKQTYVTELPAEILNLKQLRHLLAYRYEIESYAHFDSKYGVKVPIGIGSLQSLQKLCFVEANQGNGTIMTELGKMSQLRRLGIIKFRERDGIALCSSIEKLTNLRSLSITSEQKDETIDLHRISSVPNLLQRLYLAGRFEKLPHWISSLQNLGILLLKWSRLKEDPLVHLQDLPNLVHLEFLQVYDGESLHFKEGGFPKLKLLGLDKLDRLQSVTMDNGVMPGLEKLVIQRCKLLKNVPNGIEHLTMLNAIEFFDMPDELIMKLRSDGGEDYWKVANVPAVYSSYWINGGWDVYSVERFSEKESSQQGAAAATAVRSHRRSTLWKV